MSNQGPIIRTALTKKISLELTYREVTQVDQFASPAPQDSDCLEYASAAYNLPVTRALVATL